LKSAGVNVGLGNIGKSFAWQVADNNKFYVLELRVVSAN
jgi:hypothetical protein